VQISYTELQANGTKNEECADRNSFMYVSKQWLSLHRISQNTKQTFVDISLPNFFSKPDERYRKYGILFAPVIKVLLSMCRDS